MLDIHILPGMTIQELLDGRPVWRAALSCVPWAPPRTTSAGGCANGVS